MAEEKVAPSQSRPESGLPPELQRDRDVERFAKAAKLPAYMWDTLGGLSALARFMDAVRSERGDSTRLDYLAKTLHIDATGDEPIYALFIPGTEGVKSKSDLRGLIDESMQLSGERNER